MSFTEEQRRSLTAKLKRRHVKTRANHGGIISYVEGWHVIAEANRIFGYDCWDRRTVSPQCVWSGTHSGQVAALYTTRVRITVRAGGEVITREGVGTGFGRGPSAETAHEIALKAAETDATKRALATFGNPFGLALYDKDQTNVTRPPRPKQALVLYRSEREKVEFDTPDAFIEAALTIIRAIDSVDELYAFWQRNRETLAAIKSNGGPQAETLIAALKARARTLGHIPKGERPKGDDGAEAGRQSRLAFPKLKRLRNKEHLKYVARQPCLICGRRPTHAHHVRYAQSSALGAKVSDEFTVPLCSMHHDAVHRTGNERGWWVAQAIDPLKAAAQLWATTNGRAPEPDLPDMTAPAGDDAGPENTGTSLAK
jgi:DNA recombination protein Rad52